MRNVAIVILSKDKNDDIWVHFGVEVRRGKSGQREPQLSSFSGQLEGDEAPEQGVLRELHEETLGQYKGIITEEVLRDPTKTRKKRYADGNGVTLIYYTLLEENREQFSTLPINFNKFRNQRIFQETGCKFRDSRETEVKAIRLIKLKDLFHALRYANSPIRCADDVEVFYNIDINGRSYDEQGNFRDYSVWKDDAGKPVELSIPKIISLRHCVYLSLGRQLQEVILTFFLDIDKEIIKEKVTTKRKIVDDEFVIKSVRFDTNTFVDDFLLTVTRSPKQQKVFPLLTAEKGRYTVEGQGGREDDRGGVRQGKGSPGGAERPD